MTPSEIAFTLTPWRKLGRDELYDILHLRQLVFSVEQKCAYLDLDYADHEAHHLEGRSGSRLVAYARLLGPGVKFDEASIGRVVSHPEARRTGAGRALVGEAILRTHDLFGGGAIRIGAQRYLERFYASFGFVADGAPYLEDDIPHVEMLLPPLAAGG